MIPLPREDTPSWDDSEALECVMVIPEAPNVRTFAFRAPSGVGSATRPGSSLRWSLPVPGGPIYRTYTVSSSPSRSLSISVTVKAQEESVGSRWMIDNLNPGDRIRAHGPAGIFTLPPQPDGKYLFIAAGSGVTPMMSMTGYLFDRGEQPDVTLIVCARRPSELIFRGRLEHMAERMPGLKLHYVVSEEDPYDVWTGYRGRFNQLMLASWRRITWSGRSIAAGRKASCSRCARCSIRLATTWSTTVRRASMRRSRARPKRRKSTMWCPRRRPGRGRLRQFRPHGDLPGDRHGPRGRAPFRPCHPVGLHLRGLRHLQGEEARRRCAHGP